jgi:serine/threonine protein phosphatase PrpC
MHLDEQQGLEEMKSEREDVTIPAAITDTGCERDLNEDRYAVVECTLGVAWILCDGMGGATGGELAAQLVIDAVKRDLSKQQPMPPEVALRNAMIEANRVIVLRRQNQAFASMGTTAVALLFSGSEVAIANVGDSRAYLIRDGAIQQLTVDHTLVQQLVDRGEIGPEEAMAHPEAHILTRCIGAEPGLEVDVRKLWVWSTKPGEVTDTVLLCSDGLYSLVAEMEISQIVSTNSPQSACVKLVELAKARGGYDNITVSIIPLAGQLRVSPPPVAQKTSKSMVKRAPGSFVAKPVRVHTESMARGLGKHLLFSVVVSGFVAVLTTAGFLVKHFF